MGKREELVVVSSPVEGTVASVAHALGWHTGEADIVATVEATDGTTTVHTDVAGIVGEIHVQPGTPVVPGGAIMVIDPNRTAPVTPPAHAPGLDPAAGDEAETLAGKCTYCGWTELEPGFVQEESQRCGWWVRGAARFGPFGGLRFPTGGRYVIGASRCTRCSHLELFAIGDKR